MKKYCFFVFFTVFFSQAQTIYFPDANLKNRLLQASTTIGIALNNTGNYIAIDTNQDSEIQQSEALAVSTLRLSFSFIGNLTGIGYFTNLKNLEIGENQLTTLDVSLNTSLKYLVCPWNQLTVLTLPPVPILESIFYAGNFLPNLDLQGQTNLRYINCTDNQVTNLNLTTFSNLDTLVCEDNFLTSLDLTGLHLFRLIFNNNQISTIDLTGQAATLKILTFDNNQIATLNLAGFNNLETLSCKGNQLTTLNLNNSPKLETFDCSNNNLNSLSVQNNANTLLNGYTYPNSNKFKFDATNNPNLSCIFVSNIVNCNANWPSKDATSTYVNTQTQCNAVLTNTNFERSGSISIFPNPNKGLFRITGLADKSDIEIYDILGKKFHEQNLINNQQIQLQNVEKGIYVLKIITENQTVSKKISIE